MCHVLVQSWARSRITSDTALASVSTPRQAFHSDRIVVLRSVVPALRCCAGRRSADSRRACLRRGELPASTKCAREAAFNTAHRRRRRYTTSLPFGGGARGHRPSARRIASLFDRLCPSPNALPECMRLDRRGTVERSRQRIDATTSLQPSASTQTPIRDKPSIRRRREAYNISVMGPSELPTSIRSRSTRAGSTSGSAAPKLTHLATPKLTHPVVQC